MKRNGLPEYPNSDTSSNQFLIYRKHRERRIIPVASHKITVKAKGKNSEDHASAQITSYLKYAIKTNLHVLHG